MITIATRALEDYGGTELWTLTLAKYLSKHVETQIYTGSVGGVGKLSTVPVTQNYSETVIANHPTVTLPPLEKTYLHNHSSFLEIEKFVPGAKKYISISEEIRNQEIDRGFISVKILNPIDTDIYYKKNTPNKQLKNILYVGWDQDTANTLRQIVESNGYQFDSLDTPGIDLSKKIHEADLCIGIGRHLTEAMMCGRPVISLDKRSWMSRWIGSGYIEPKDFYTHQHDNYSGRTSLNLTDPNYLIDHIQKYDYRHGEMLADLTRNDHGASIIAEKYMRLIYG